ncbi:hypothetical protein [Dyadobacter aurulentus]|uniref:hypothetical protein n=1 Tax=Dyadobacter sp. UC 10 TaxID=2605428 RepID=UPI0011F16A68|nr:hypothetical protein [Dyadobacter sp. UC 10]KAA0992461.1 hypothetical protein FXO21_20930 [Dyadobacter sp. UC 10]
MMHTSQNSGTEDKQSANLHSDDAQTKDALYYAYGLKVKDLLSQSDAEDWIEDLWDMYTAPRRPASHISAKKRAMILVDTTGS